MEQILRALRAVAEPTRLRLLAICGQGEFTVSELVGVLGQSQPRVSRHLKVLCDAGLLDRAPEGGWVFYRVTHTGDGAKLASQLIAQIPHDDPTHVRDLERIDKVTQERSGVAAAYFRENAAHWDLIRKLHVDDIDVDKEIKEILPADVGGRLLDIGTGTGHMLEILGSMFERAEGIDRSHDMLSIARSHLAQWNLGNCGVRFADMYQLPHPAAAFDMVSVHQVLHYADAPNRVIAEAARVLSDRGYILIVDFAPHDLEELRHKHQHRRLGFDDAEVSRWCDASGLELLDVRRLPGDPLTVAIWLASKLGSNTSISDPGLRAAGLSV